MLTNPTKDFQIGNDILTQINTISYPRYALIQQHIKDKIGQFDCLYLTLAADHYATSEIHNYFDQLVKSGEKKIFLSYADANNTVILEEKY